MNLAAALVLAERTGEPQTCSWSEGGAHVRVRVRLSDYDERQLALIGSEAQGMAIAQEAGFGRWSTEREGRAIILTEIEAADAPDDVPPWEDVPVLAATVPVPAAEPRVVAEYRPGRPYPAQWRPENGRLYHAHTRAGQLYTVIVRGDVTAWRCDGLDVCVPEQERRGWREFQAWQQTV